MYPVALEGALKLKEISYVHAEGYAAGELKPMVRSLWWIKICQLLHSPRDELIKN